MAVSSTKLKLLYVMKTLIEKTDEDHVMSAADLIKVLQNYGLNADRKSIYADIETLSEFGMDIVQTRGGSKPGYYVASRDFELPELKLLVDAVQASKFITEKKSRELIKKIEKLASEHEARQLQRDVVIINRLKTGNETIYYNVDKIHTGILENRQISFYYTNWNFDKTLVPKKDGLLYKVSPWALIWADENYYLIAYDDESEKIKHYRVDKMKNTETIGDERLGRSCFADFDLAVYAKKTFGMYSGYDAVVSLQCENDLIGVIIDRFAKDVTIIPDDNERFNVNVLISVSPQFFGWLAGLGGRVKITAPERVKKEYKEFIEKIVAGLD